MLSNILEILSKKKIGLWKINIEATTAIELFFIKKKLDMSRSKDVSHLKLTVYKDFEMDGVKYRGSSTAEIHPHMSKEEIAEIVDTTYFAASLIKNKYYPLAEPSSSIKSLEPSSFDKKPLEQWIPELTEAIFAEDVYEDRYLNSAELFLNKVQHRIINSKGIDVSYSSYDCSLEFVCSTKGEAVEVEIYKYLKFSEFTPELISESIKESLHNCSEKAKASKTPALKKSTILLSGEAVKEFFNYYYNQSKANSVYAGISSMKLGEKIQGEKIQGDPITITLDPYLSNSTKSAPYDSQGTALNKLGLIKEGTLLNYWGDVRFCSYLQVPVTGEISNICIEGGSKSLEELRREPHLELVAFSDFQMDSLTGNFAGEIRLGWYFDGTSRKPVTGGSISGNIKEVQKNMYLSKELQQDNGFRGPRSLQLFNISVAGE